MPVRSSASVDQTKSKVVDASKHSIKAHATTTTGASDAAIDDADINVLQQSICKLNINDAPVPVTKNETVESFSENISKSSEQT